MRQSHLGIYVERVKRHALPVKPRNADIQTLARIEGDVSRAGLLPWGAE